VFACLGLGRHPLRKNDLIAHASAVHTESHDEASGVDPDGRGVAD